MERGAFRRALAFRAKDQQLLADRIEQISMGFSGV
jgi:hypothetical protein